MGNNKEEKKEEKHEMCKEHKNCCRYGFFRRHIFHLNSENVIETELIQ